MELYNQSGLQIEFEVLKICARTELGPPAIERVQSLLNKDMSWSLFVQLSQYHAVTPLLYQSLKIVGTDYVPAQILNQLHRTYHATAAHNLLLLKELDRVVRFLEGHDIPLIAFKGPILAKVAYRNLGFRPCSDIDILVPTERFSQVEQLLIEDGYSPVGKQQSLHGLHRALNLYLSQQHPFARSGIFGLDVHRKIMPPGYRYNVAFETLLQRSEHISIGDVSVHSFEREDLLQILCYHGAKNRWERLKHVCDVAELIRVNPDLDWDKVMSRASATNGTRVLGLGFYLAHKLLQVQLPPVILAWITDDKRIEQMGVWVLSRLPSQMQLGIASYSERVRFHLKLQESVRDKMRYGIYSFLRQLNG